MRTPLTKEGKEKLEGELQRLKNKERPAIIRAIATARAHGDLSETPNILRPKKNNALLRGGLRNWKLF